MRASVRDATATSGLAKVVADFCLIGWAPVENPQPHDLGTDLWIAVRDQRRFDLGRLIGAQVKSGPSYFRDAQTDENGDVQGWWYYEPDVDHFDYWVKHTSPHLLVLRDTNEEVSYWVHVEAERCVATGKGMRILVPRSQTVDASNHDLLLDVACKQVAEISLEGTAYDAAAYNIAPADRLRYAMLVPRFIAPHPNRGVQLRIEPEEAIALMVKCNIQQLRELIENLQLWPKLDETPATQDWRWHLAHALWLSIAKKDASKLVEVIGSCPRPDWHIGATVLLASHRYQEGLTHEALSHVSAAIDADRGNPTDHAWLLLHRAWYTSELGDVDAARIYALDAQSTLQRQPADVTASILLGSAAKLLFELRQRSTVLDDDLSGLIRASDNVGSWWRDQRIGWTLMRAAEQDFRDWAEDLSSKWEADPPVHGMLAAAWNSAYCADFRAWIAAEIQLGCYWLRRSSTTSQATEGLISLLLGGDVGALRQACKRLSNSGPAAAVRELSRRCTPKFLTRSRLGVVCAYWEECADTAYPESAHEFATWCINILSGESFSPLIAQDDRVSTTRLSSALAGVLNGCEKAMKSRAVPLLMQLPRATLGDLVSLAQLAASLVEHGKDAEIAAHILDGAHVPVLSQDPRLKARLLFLAHEFGSPEAKDLLLKEAIAPNYFAAAEAYSGGLLAATDAGLVIKALSQRLLGAIVKARAGHHGMNPSLDPARFLVLMNLAFPEVADWEVIVAYLAEPSVLADNKAEACHLISARLEHLPQQVRTSLSGCISGIAGSVYLPSNVFETAARKPPATDLAMLLEAALVGISDSSLSALFAGDVRSQVGALRLLHLQPDSRFDFVLLRMLRERALPLRHGAAQVIGKRVNKGQYSVALESCLDLIAQDQGGAVPLALLQELKEAVSPQVVGRLLVLIDHASGRIRDEINRLVAVAGLSRRV